MDDVDRSPTDLLLIDTLEDEKIVTTDHSENGGKVTTPLDHIIEDSLNPDVASENHGA